VPALLGKLPGMVPAVYALIADGTPLAVKKARWLVNAIGTTSSARRRRPSGRH